ncbi:MAG: hypothetical protein JO276_14810 [Sphingomonadaceae bacterium]|nr:hypothetical protein [Sphingomonadaceae bacterium]
MRAIDKELFSSLLSASFAPPTVSERNGDSVRRDRLNSVWGKGKPDKPTYLYLMMIDLDGDGNIRVQKKEGDLGASEVRAKEIEFADDIVGGRGDVLDFESIKFTKPSWFTIVLNMDKWYFYYPDPDDEAPSYKRDHDPVVFANEKVYFDDKRKEIILPRDPNYSFYNSKQAYVPVDAVPRDGVRIINFFRKNDQGDEIGMNEKREYTFNLFLRGPLAQNGKEVTIIIDPDGQNQGPPGPVVPEEEESSESEVVLKEELA